MSKSFTSLLYLLMWVAAWPAFLLVVGCGSAAAPEGAAQPATGVTVEGPAFILFYTDN